MGKKLKNNFLLKILFVGFLALALFFSPFPQRQASAWIDTVIPKVILPPMQTLLDQLQVMLTGALQQAAIKMISENVYSSISGGSGSGGTKFIVNWQTALETDPQKEAAIFIESMSSMSTQMRGSFNYKSSEGVGGNYMSGLGNIVGNITSQATNSNKCPISTITPGNLLSTKTFKPLESFTDPWTYKNCMQATYEEKLNSLKEIATAQAIAYQGFKGTGSGGNISYPGSAVAAKMFNVENMGNEVIVNADGIAKVITSIVMKMGMDAMNNGIGNIQEQIQKGATNVSNKINTQVQNQTKNFGPGAMFGNFSGN